MSESPFSNTKLKTTRVLSLIFSEGTYQAEVLGPADKHPFWPMLQIDDGGRVLDTLCSCSTAEKTDSCIHLAASSLKIFNNSPLPLHVRFRHSLWSSLCQILSRRHGYASTVLRPTADGYEALSEVKKRLFFVRAKTTEAKKRLKALVEERPLETEETSLKFSNLPAEELALWKQGRPSPKLSFELSFWSDIAKWLMLSQEEEHDYTITFRHEGRPLPSWIEISFANLQLHAYLAQANWPELIPSLSSVKSPLKVHEFQTHNIHRITYDPSLKQMHLEFVEKRKQEAVSAEDSPHQIGEWLYVPDKGFYPASNDPLLEERTLSADKIATLLKRHPHIVNKYLKGTLLHLDPIKACVQMHIDTSGALHICSYLFEPGDLQRPSSAYFAPWAYLEDKGFYLLDNPRFDTAEKIVPKEKVSDFVGRHRVWLQEFEGFQIHMTHLASHMSYSVSKDRALCFENHLDLPEENTNEMIDFGDWFYVKSQGFYSKMTEKPTSSLHAPLQIPASDVSRFIRLHYEELEQIKGFFSSRCPLEKSGLEIHLDADERIVVSPQFVYSPLYHERHICVFGDFLFVEGEGFSEVPAPLRLPEGYLQHTVISKDEEPYFVAYELDVLSALTNTIDSRLIKPKTVQLNLLLLKKDLSSPIPSWIVQLEYQTNVGSLPAYQVWESLCAHKRYLFSPGGLLFLQGARFNWLKPLKKKRWQKGGKWLRLSSLELIRLLAFEDLALSREETHTGEMTQLLEEITQFHSQEPLDLTELRSTLRLYQETGLRWLWFLYCNGLSGLLCDEMGLGKTHQAMALLAAAHRKTPQGKYLVVCPTSVIYHWQELLKRFLPSLRVCIFYGTQRSLEDFEEQGDLILTSYGIVRTEKELLSSLAFDIAIFDEIQIAKNSRSQTHRTLRAIDAKMVVGLTGTPIENKLIELKALFDIILPSYLPLEKVFRDIFVNPIEKNQDLERKTLLSRLIKPFILRRKKTEVLQELPEKVEQIAYCELSEEQKKLYAKTFLREKQSLFSQLQDTMKPPPYLHIFSLLSTLKQICDHPCLITKKIDDYHKHQCGKWDLFIELLEETRSSNQKLVVFSQYLDMLNIIEAYLTEKRIGFAGIRGSTRDRKEQIERFRDDPQCEVFVGSLQAAGVGIDLVAASVVIHYDRWWNPAKENQATDRVHRIGQNRGVQVFKMVTKHTIEEHIHQLIEKKLSLLEGVIGFDDQDHIKGLDRGALIELLRHIDQEITQE